jgi:hypothetical protein
MHKGELVDTLIDLLYQGRKGWHEALVRKAFSDALCRSGGARAAGERPVWRHEPGGLPSG